MSCTPGRHVCRCRSSFIVETWWHSAFCVVWLRLAWLLQCQLLVLYSSPPVSMSALITIHLVTYIQLYVITSVFTVFFTEAVLQGSTGSSATTEIAQVSSHYTVQGHSRSLMLIPIIGLYAASYYWKMPTCSLHSVARHFQLLCSIGKNYHLWQGGASR